jgi:hypothetical protein
MTPKRKNAIIRKIKDIGIGSTLILSLISSASLLQSCSEESSSDQSFTSSDYYADGSPKESVQTYIQEVEANKFQIVHEEISTEYGDSRAYISYLNGTTKSFTLEEAQQLLAQQAPDTTVSVPQNQIDTLSKTTAVNSSSSIPHNDYSQNSSTQHSNSNGGSYQSYHGGGSSLSTILYYSALGNMLGRSHTQYAPTHFYHSSDSYNRSLNTNSSLRNSLSSRPKSSSSGFFGGSSSSRSRSFSS